MTGQVPAGAGEKRDLSSEIAEFRTRLDRLRAQSGADRTSREDLLAELETAHEELRVADEEVRTQQEELDQLASLHRTERWLHDRLVAMMPAAVLVTDGHGVVRTANAASAALLRVRADRLVGKPVFSFIEPAERGDVRRLLAAAVAGGRGFRTTATVAPRGVDPFGLELAATVARDERSGTTRVTWVCLRGDTSRTDASAGDPLLAQCLLEVIRQTLDTADTATVLQRVAGIARRAFPVEAWVSITVGPPAEPQLVASDSRTAQAVDGAQLTSGQGPCERAWEQRETVTSHNLLADQR
jgi:PAS domain-containing protein